MVRLEPWTEADLPLLEALNAPEMTAHLGGPETAEQLAKRLARYAHPEPGKDHMFKIVDAESGRGVGSVGYWPREWRADQIFEMGWSVVPEAQGRGIAKEATAQAIQKALAENPPRPLHAFPSIDNAPSNGMCTRLGFRLLGECDFEYPPGHQMRCNDWVLDPR